MFSVTPPKREQPMYWQGPRYFASGPQGIFWTDSLELARKLCALIDPPDEDGSYEWTITDALNQHGEAMSKEDE